jgi:hypothetical protein
VARHGRGAEQAAGEPRALLVREVDERDRARRRSRLGGAAQHLERAGDAEHAVEPAAVRHRVDVRADDHHPLAGAAQVRPDVAGLVPLDVRAGRLELLPDVAACLHPLVGPADAARAAGVAAAGQVGERVQVGDRAGGIERHQSVPP